MVAAGKHLRLGLVAAMAVATIGFASAPAGASPCHEDPCPPCWADPYNAIWRKVTGLDDLFMCPR